MFRKILMSGLLLVTVLSVSACGKNSAAGKGNETADSSSAESGPVGEEAEEGEPSESTEEAEDLAEENSASYIFSEMPVAAYEVTGLKVGPDETFYDGLIDDYNAPFVELGENTFILYCLPGGDNGDENGVGDEYGVSRLAAVQSPSGSGSWEAHGYTTGDYPDEYVPEGYSSFLIMETGDCSEETYGGRFGSLVDPWLNYIRFSEIFHPDAPQTDVIYVIEIATFAESDKDQDTMLSAVTAALEEGGATVSEIPVEDALAGNNIVVLD